MFIHLRLDSLAKTMAPKISSSRYLGPRSTPEAVKRPELGFDSVTGGIIEGGKHDITRQ
jgi:hypothetical protein